MAIKKLAALVAFTAIAAAASAQLTQMNVPIDSAVRYGHLPNGLTYYIRHNSLPEHRADFYIAQKVGSVQEDDSQRGLAHFLEHMCFNGSKNFPGGGIVAFCERIGVKFGRDINAYTSTDETVYNINNVPVSDSNVDSCLLILHDWADGLTLDPAEIDKERGVIHEEWRMRSSAMQRILERQLPTLYPGSKYGHRMPIGLLSVIDSFKPKTLRDYYEKWYRPDLQGIVIVGDFDAAEMEEKVKSAFADIQMPANAAKYETYPVPDNDQPIYIVDKDKELTSPSITVLFRDDPLPDSLKETPMFFGLEYMRGLSELAINSRLAECARKADSPFDDAAVNYGGDILAKTKDAFYLQVTPKAGRGAEALEAAMKEVVRARKFGITDTELFRAKQEYLSRLEKIYDNRDKQKNTFYVQQYVRHFLERDPIPSTADEYKFTKLLADNVTPEYVNRYFSASVEHTDTNFVVLATYPDKEGVSIPTTDELRAAVGAAASAELTPYVDKVKVGSLVPKLPKKGKIVKEEPAAFGYTHLRLSNGANIYFRSTDFNDSQVIFSGISFGGTRMLKNADLANTKVFDYVMNSTGIGDFTQTELDKKLAGIQAGTQVSLDRTEETIMGSSTPKDLRTLFEMIYLRFAAPTNDQEGYDNTISQLKTALENAGKRPETAFSDSITASIYSHNPEARRLMREDLDHTDYAKIKAIYSDRFSSPADFDFFFVGKINADSLRLFAEQYIASLPACKKREKRATAGMPTAEETVENKFTRAMETPKTYIFSGFIGKDGYTLRKDITSDICGQILRKIYTRTIREDAGIAYTVQADADYNFNPEGKYWVDVICPTKPAKADSALLLINQGLEQVATQGPAKSDLDDVVKYMLKAEADRQKENGYWNSLIRDKVVYGIDRHEGYEEIVKSITTDDIKKFASDIVLGKKNRVNVVMMPEDFNDKHE